MNDVEKLEKADTGPPVIDLLRSQGSRVSSGWDSHGVQET